MDGFVIKMDNVTILLFIIFIIIVLIRMNCLIRMDYRIIGRDDEEEE